MKSHIKTRLRVANNARVDRRVLLDMSVVMTIDYAGGSAGRTTGSRRIASGTSRSTKSTRAFTPRSGVNGQAHWPALKQAPNLAGKERLGVTLKKSAGSRVQ